MQSVLQALFLHMNEAVVIRTVSGYITGLNRAAERIYGYSAQEATRLRMEVLVPERRRNDLAVMEGKVLDGEDVRRLETIRQSKDGREVRVFITLVPIWDPEGKATHFMELTDPFPGREQMILSLAHNLRNALSAMSTVSYLMEHSFEKKHLERLNRQLGLCDSIVNNLLEYGGVRVSRKEEINLNRLASDVISLFDFPRQIEVRLIAANEVTASVDRGQLEQVLVNLFQNAIDALVGQPGEIQIQILDEPSCARIEVSDNGPGIGLSDLQQVFEPMVTTKADGMGLGLAACKQMVEANHGKIEVESEKGRGTRFSVSLPKGLS